MTVPSGRNGSNSMGPQVMSGFLNKDYLYGVNILVSGGAQAFRWHEPTNSYETIDLSAVAGNHLDLPLFDSMDDHYGLALGVDDQDRLFVAGNNHENLSGRDGGPPTTTHILVCNNVNAFANPASWAAALTTHLSPLSEVAGALPGVYTYHLFERMTDGTLLHFLSQSEKRTDTQGRDYLAFKRRAGAWSSVLSSGGHFATTIDGPSTEADRVYVCGLYVQPNGAGVGVDRVHVYGIWRTNDDDGESQQAPWYIYSDDLTTWKYKADPVDGVQSMPITWSNRSSAEITADFSRSFRQGVFVDPSTGRPSVIVRNAGVDEFRRYEWTGSAWAFTTIVSALTGEYRDFLVKGQRWMRAHRAGRIVLRRVSDNATVRIGGRVTTVTDKFSAWPCPVWLRERGVFAVNVPVGNTTQVCTFGKGARLNKP